MSKFTPGPWIVCLNDGAYVKQDDLATLRIEERASDSPDELVVALVVTDCQRLKETGAWNARLISAAPDLLAACKALINLCDCDEGTIGKPRDVFNPHTRRWEIELLKTCPLCGPARAAIYKAEPNDE